jgi:hypothetical protein
MTLSSYSDVFSITHDREHHEDIHAGDTVRMGENFHPHYQVIAVSDDKAWVRNVLTGVDCLAALARCRKLPPAVMLAAE